MTTEAERLDRHLERVRSAGYKVTNARRTVLAVLLNMGGHVTSSDVLEAVATEDASIGRASVFRTLDLLTQLNIIRPTFVDTSATPQYVMMPDGHHHHIICTQCSRLIHFEDCGLSALQKRLEAEFGLSIMGHLLEFYALCKECMSKTASAADAQ